MTYEERSREREAVRFLLCGVAILSFILGAFTDHVLSMKESPQKVKAASK